MKKLLTTLCAGALAAVMTGTSAVPSLALPNLSTTTPQGYSDVTPAQFVTEREIRRLRRGERTERRVDRRDDRMERRADRREARRDFEQRNGGYYYRGYRGYRNARPGYRAYNGYYFPSAAFIAGALVTGAIVNSQARTSGNAHVEWCYNRYRSYRAADDTYQPLNGPRQVCNSPY